MRAGWARLGLRGRLAISIAAIVLTAFTVVLVVVRREMADERATIKHEEHLEAGQSPPAAGDGEVSPLSPVEEAQSEVQRTFLLVAGAALAASLLAGYLLAARTAAPLRRMAATASAVDAGDLTPRIGPERSASVEARILAEAFDHMLDRLDDAFSRQRQFVSDASHELRTPLTAIRGQLEVLASSDPGPAEVRRVEGVVLVEMGRIERLVDDLLVLARLDEGAPLAADRIRLAPYLRSLAEDEALGAVAIGELAAGTLNADPDRLTQVIRNLIHNARRHAGPEGRVAISAVAQGSRLTIRVDDDGPGITPAERQRVFDRFHRSGDTARERQTGGSGLGLAIARSIVELHDGRIWVEESPLGGARVAFELDRFEPQLGTA